MEYVHRGCVFEYYVLPETGTGLYVADGYLKSDLNIRRRTATLPTEREAVLAFMEWAKLIADAKKAP